MIDELPYFEHVDRQFDIHVPLDATAPHRVGELLCRFCYHRVAIVIEPVDQRSDWRILLIFDQRRVIEGPDQPSLGAEQFEQTSVVYVECETASGGIQIGPSMKMASRSSG